MTDYGEEQRNELEALESIYPDSFTGDTSAAVAPAAALGWSGMGRSRRGPQSPKSGRRREQRVHHSLKFPRSIQALASKLHGSFPFSACAPAI